jgi:hypothetical protein
VHTGSVTFAQRFGSLLQLNPHAHSWLPDGVFVSQADGALRFEPLPPPTDAEVACLCARIAQRVGRLFERHDDGEGPCWDDDESVIAADQAHAVRAPTRRLLWFELPPQRPATPLSAQCDGFSLHAGLAVAADDRDTLQRLLRYGSRPPFAQRRLSVLADGTVRLQLRKPYYTGQTALRLEPLAFLRRVLALVPPPRWHLTRYHGIFSSHHRLRPRLAALRPKPPPSRPATPAPEPEVPPAEPVPQTKRPSYARLLARVFSDDLGACSRCGGPLRLISCIEDPAAIVKILRHLGLPTELPRPAPARSPPQLDLEL